MKTFLVTYSYHLLGHYDPWKTGRWGVFYDWDAEREDTLVFEADSYDEQAAIQAIKVSRMDDKVFSNLHSNLTIKSYKEV